jgi:hypothetical protein
METGWGSASLYPRISMCRAGRRGLQLDDGPSDPFPDGLPFEIAAIEHQIGALGRRKLGLVTMLPDQQVGGSPDVEVGDHQQVPRKPV